MGTNVTVSRDDILADISESFNTNYVGFASFTVIIWDHIDTFADEVEYIWKRDKGPIGYLFLINRYLTPAGFILNLFAYTSPAMTPDRCDHFVRFEGSMTLIGLHIVSMMMFLRVRALYYPKKWPLLLLGMLFSAQFVIYTWLMTKGQRVVHVPGSGIHACTMIFPPELSVIASATAWIPLVYDSTVFGLTLYKTITSLRRGSKSRIIKRILEDGMLYYSVIFAINFVLTLMIIFAPPGLKNITAQTELLMTVTMMSRITINLKKSVHKLIGTMDKVHQSVGPSVTLTSSSKPQKLMSYDELNHTSAAAPIGGYTPSRLPVLHAPRHQSSEDDLANGTQTKGDTTYRMVNWKSDNKKYLFDPDNRI